MARLPTLALPIHRTVGVPCSADDLRDVRAAWFKATQRAQAAHKSWKSFDAQDKRRLVHQVAQRAQTDERDYFTPYLEVDIDDIISNGQWSVEHVVPRSKCKVAEGDVWNFVEADRRENSARSNLPLKLWPDKPNQIPTSKFQTFNNEVHYAPPSDQRARLARKWLYTQAMYQCAPMSSAQRAHLPEIIALAKRAPPDTVELNVAKQLEVLTGTRNPLILDAEPSRWYDSPEWRALVGCACSFKKT